MLERKIGFFPEYNRDTGVEDFNVILQIMFLEHFLFTCWNTYTSTFHCFYIRFPRSENERNIISSLLLEHQVSCPLIKLFNFI